MGLDGPAREIIVEPTPQPERLPDPMPDWPGPVLSQQFMQVFGVPSNQPPSNQLPNVVGRPKKFKKSRGYAQTLSSIRSRRPSNPRTQHLPKRKGGTQ